MDNITRFLLELRSGFSFVWREYRIKIGETETFIMEYAYLLSEQGVSVEFYRSDGKRYIEI